MVMWSATEWTLLLGAVIGGITSIIMVVQRSTCTEIKCLGCIDCKRQVRTMDELERAVPPDIGTNAIVHNRVDKVLEQYDAHHLERRNTVS
jgi:hypothetical protein